MRIFAQPRLLIPPLLNLICKAPSYKIHVHICYIFSWYVSQYPIYFCCMLLQYLTVNISKTISRPLPFCLSSSTNFTRSISSSETPSLLYVLQRCCTDNSLPAPLSVSAAASCSSVSSVVSSSILQAVSSLPLDSLTSASI